MIAQDGIRLVRPGPEHREQALAFRKEFFENGEPVIFGSELSTRRSATRTGWKA